MPTQTVAPNPNLQVITHNGLLPSQGGKRMGYRAFNQATGTWAVFWLTPPIVVVQPKPVEPPPPTLPSAYADDFLTLYQGCCPHCGRYIGSLRLRRDEVQDTADAGPIWLHVCGSCGKRIRHW
ncbi:MAG: hypothetical protein AAB767_02245 [Patescibacteria group bacterium]